MTSDSSRLFSSLAFLIERTFCGAATLWKLGRLEPARVLARSANMSTAPSPRRRRRRSRRA